MKDNNFSPRLRKASLILLGLMVLAVSAWVVFLWFKLPADTLRENITMEEAQALVSFPICAPAYIPIGVDSIPRVVYESDAANVPEEMYIRLRYNFTDSNEKALEVYQRYTNTSSLRTSYSDLVSVHEGAVINMLWWLSLPKVLSESETKHAIEQVMLEAEVFQAEQTVWWLYEIVDPEKYRSTMTHWISNHVEYRVVSSLPADEIKKVTLPMLKCLRP